MKRLYLKLYLALLAVLVISAVVFAVIAHHSPLRHRGPGRLPEIAARALWRSLPAPTDPRFERLLSERARELSLDLVVYHERDGIVAESAQVAVPSPEDLREGWQPTEEGVFYGVRVEGGHWLSVRDRTDHGRRLTRRLLGFFAFAALLGVACYPVARAMTRRLESLELAVKRWGKGDLSQRVPIEGKDEIATLAASFNQSAERIEALVASGKSVLAHASHEFRSPLARLRVNIELMLDEADQSARQRLAQEAERDIAELDGLVKEVLDAARADARLEDDRGPVDIAELTREEAARVGARVTAPERLSLVGDARLLCRLLRNLLENARRHAAEGPIEVELSTTEGTVELAVRDRGPGVDEADRERIFLPFYRRAGHREGEQGSVGLGLALVKQIAEAHGGSVHYEPRSGSGASFVVKLPAQTQGGRLTR